MKNKSPIFIFICMTLLLSMTGCGMLDKTSDKEKPSAEDTDIPDISYDIGSVSNFTDDTADSPDIDEQDNNTGFIPYTWNEISLLIPREWNYGIDENENGFSIYHKPSREADEYMGYVCGFSRSQEYFNYGMGEKLIGFTEDGIYYYQYFPTDVQFDFENEELSAGYLAMYHDAQLIESLIRIDGVEILKDEYILPTSEFRPIDDEDIEYFSDNSLWIARNEIYARHGRLFDNPYLQNYFNRNSWYNGTIAPSDFDEGVLSQVEKDNILFLKNAEDKYKSAHTYPKKYNAGKDVRVDLDGDQKDETIDYHCKGYDENTGTIDCSFTVNGKAYNVAEFCEYLDSPETDFFYVTDLRENDGQLELAVVDYGPSSDYITMFFTFDGGSLIYIGTIGGFPFADMNNGVNGFSQWGGITGMTRMDLIETVYLEENYRYDEGARRIVENGSDMNNILPTGGHALYTNLPVHLRTDLQSAIVTIQAQDEVYFIESDMSEWILVKGKNGERGYMHVKDGMVTDLDKPASEVFSDLYYFD